MSFKAMYSLGSTLYYHRRHQKLSNRVSEWVDDNLSGDNARTENMHSVYVFMSNELEILSKDTEEKDDKENYAKKNYLSYRKRVEESLPFIMNIKRDMRNRKLGELGI